MEVRLGLRWLWDKTILLRAHCKGLSDIGFRALLGLGMTSMHGFGSAEHLQLFGTFHCKVPSVAASSLATQYCCYTIWPVRIC